MLNKNGVRALALVAGVVVWSMPALALQSFEGKVQVLEPTYLPGAVAFDMDAGNTACPAGKQLKWQKPDPENNKATYSTLLAALVSGKRVRVYINDNDTNCIVHYLHLLNN